MKKEDFKNARENVKTNSGILFNGFIKTAYGALIAGMFAAAICGFIHTASKSGYTAVFLFVASCLLTAFALCNVYLSGSKNDDAECSDEQNEGDRE